MIWVELDDGVCYELGDDSFLLWGPGAVRRMARAPWRQNDVPQLDPQALKD